MTVFHRRAVAGCLVALALLAWVVDRAGDGAAPSPQPPTGLVLKGLFYGPTAAEDAITIAGFTGEIGDCIQHDGTLADPRLKTGAAFDDLRVRVREVRCRGVSIGERQPKVRDAIHAYLDEVLGTSGGPVTPAERSKWVSAMKEIQKAAIDATK